LYQPCYQIGIWWRFPFYFKIIILAFLPTTKAAPTIRRISIAIKANGIVVELARSSGVIRIAAVVSFASSWLLKYNLS
jgi:hypothetical protein